MPRLAIGLIPPIVSVAGLALPCLAQGVFTISDQAAAYTQSALPLISTGNGPASNFTVVDFSIDHLVQMGWWYGVGTLRSRELTFIQDDVVETEFHGLDAVVQTYSLAQFDARLDASILRDGHGAVLTQIMTVTNTTSFPLTLDLFNYLDPSLGDTNADDTSTGRQRPDTFTLRDQGARVVADYAAPFLFAFQGGTAPNVRDMLTDSSRDVFHDQGLPYDGPNLSLGVQFRFEVIPPGGSRSCTIVLAINTPAPYIPNGSCILDGGECVLTTEHDCGVRGGTFVGEGTHCPTACPCDWNLSGALNSQDFFDFVTDFFTGPADYNADGVTNSQDYFDFLTCFFTAPGACFP